MKKYRILLSLLTIFIAIITIRALVNESSKGDRNNPLYSQFEELENKFDAHLGVYSIDTETNKTISFNENDRFAFASTFKALGGGLILRDYSWNELNENVMITKEDIVDYSPITEKYIGIGLPLKEIIAAAINYSDNTAGNIILNHLKGPKGFQKNLEGLGDFVTDSTRYETELNEATPGDIRDTSTPKAMAENLQKIALSTELSQDKREFYKELLLQNTTGNKLIKAGVPDDVLVGDKTGASNYGTRNDIAILYPKDRKPIVLVVLSNKTEKGAQYQDELIAEAAKIVSKWANL